MVKLVGNGQTTNRDAVGARVEVVVKNSPYPLVRSVRAGEGFLSQSTKWLHFGLGPHDIEIDKVIVHWPTGGSVERVSTLTGFTPDRRYVIHERDGVRVAQKHSTRSVNLRQLPIQSRSQADDVRVSAVSLIPLPQFTYENLEEEAAQTPTGVWTLVKIWATWCKPCHKQLQEISERADELTERGIQVVALNVDWLDKK